MEQKRIGKSMNYYGNGGEQVWPIDYWKDYVADINSPMTVELQ